MQKYSIKIFVYPCLFVIWECSVYSNKNSNFKRKQNVHNRRDKREQFYKNRKKYENNFFLEKNATRAKIEKQVKEVNKI